MTLPHPRCRLRAPGPAAPVDVAPPRCDDPRLAGVIAPDARLVLLYDGATWCEGPVWWSEQDMLVWSDVVGRRTLGWHRDGMVEALVDPTHFANGNAIDAQGRMVHCEHGRRGISRTDASGTHLIADRFDGQRLNAPNDLIVARDGSIWFTDPVFGIQNPKQGCPADPELDHTSVYRLRDDGGIERMADLDQPNGLCFTPDERRLYVSQTPEDGSGPVAVFAFDWDGQALSKKGLFVTVPQGVPDGFYVDDREWLWVSSADGIHIFDADGRAMGHVPTPHVASNCTFGMDGTRLFITGGECLWSLDLRRP